MNVTIDATSLLLPSAGVKTYLHYWLSSLLDSAREDGSQISTYPPGVVPGSIIEHQQGSPRALRLLLVHLCNARGNPLLRLMLAGADVFHASQHVARLPRRRNVTATVFDLSCWTTPEDHTPANVAATRRYGETILKAADGLIAISSHTRDDAMSILGISGERIRVIYPGVPEVYFDVPTAQTAIVRKKYRLHAPYLLFVGCIEPRKNIPMLIRAYRQLRESIRRDLELVIAGPLGWESQETRNMLNNGGNGVRYLGYVPELELPGLFRGALALVYPSHYEGFGLPVAQAMAAGVPVITSDRSCLPEVVGDTGLLVNPDSPDQLNDAIERLVTQPDFASSLARRGQERAAAMFRWSVCARQSLAFFHQVAGQ